MLVHARGRPSGHGQLAKPPPLGRQSPPEAGRPVAGQECDREKAGNQGNEQIQSHDQTPSSEC